MVIKMKDLLGFLNDLEKIDYGIGFKLVLKRNKNDRALFSVNAGAGVLANNCNMEIRDTTFCVPYIDPRNDNRITVQKGLSKNNIVVFSFYKRKTFYKNVTDATNLLFELGVKSGFEIPQDIMVISENNSVNDHNNDSSILNEMDITEYFCKSDSVSFRNDRTTIYYGAKNYFVAFNF